LIDITTLVRQWLTTGRNDGLALIAANGGRLRITIDSKENRATSHPAEIEVVLAGPAGPA
jgi:hypothetical protein